MFNSRYSDVLTVILVVVIIAIIGLLGFWAYDVYSRNSTINDAMGAINEFENQINNNNNNNNTNNEINNNVNNVVPPTENVVKPDVGGIMNPNTTNTTTPGGSTATLYNGFVMAGYIEIPKTGIKYPVLEEVTKKSIETSVAILYGPGLNKVGNTTIVGHNYRNGLFFSDNKKISAGDKIYITDLTGNKVTYIVYNTYETTPEDSDYMTRDTNGATEISLSTCTDDSSGRIIIWARAE